MRVKSLRTEINDIEIYAIISPDTNQVFVGKIKYPHHYQAYKDHVRLRKAPTKKLFSEATQQTHTFPTMYLLERLDATEAVAYGHLIAWTKYFLDKGFQVLAHQKNLDYAEDLLDENKLYYLSIKDKSLEEITAEENILVSDYKSQKKKNDSGTPKPNMICFYVTPDEYEKVNRESEQAGMSMSKYCKQLVINNGTPIGPAALAQISFFEYFEELTAIVSVLREIQLGIYQSGNYFPADLENMEKLVDQVNRNYKNAILYTERQINKLQKVRSEIESSELTEAE